ncbi:AAA family ATPase [Novosphingobium umbonatum]|uniref:AAA family ATPase n=1 Tax=Novosphingobium umbonatum TaxID=1908524 RepID=A0A3S2V9R3_9SPHN|nr:AAA family ATPase [Novosphingobium umbonatum]RVU02204.1 AAA family ATPase [Novosphingobium umbonatum]
MDEFSIIRSFALRIGQGIPAKSALALALAEWAAPNMPWLLDEVAQETPDWADICAKLAASEARVSEPSHGLATAKELADLLGFAAFDARLLQLAIAAERLPRVQALVQIAARHGHDMPVLLGELAGAESATAEGAVRRSPVLRMGLAGFELGRDGVLRLDLRWQLNRLLNRAPSAGEDLLSLLVGARQEARLTLEDFGHVADADMLRRLLAGALAHRAGGINILIHGPPGTGKTELALALAAAAQAPLHAIGEADDDGEEPTRWDRVQALQLAQRALSGQTRPAILLFDEMEDLIGDTQRSQGDWMHRREGSKVFINRMLETNPLPVIWTTNALGNVDDAILRRMSFVLRMGHPPRSTALRMAQNIARDEGVTTSDAMAALIDVAPETTSVLRVSARVARLAGERDGGARAAGSLVQALRGGPMPLASEEMIDLDLFETGRPLAPLLDAVAAGGGSDVSLLLSGPPGTGKTALAHHFARALDRPLLVKRASDLLSKWVGETEKAIAEAFEEARRSDGVLLFDEADSLLFDRSQARASWEVGQVNELLTWLDRHPLPVVAATNHADKLDPASLRRFVFKLKLEPLGPERVMRAFRQRFGMEPPEGLAALRNLTPGDFAVVARQLRHAPARDAADILARLRDESEAKGGASVRMGF